MTKKKNESVYNKLILGVVERLEKIEDFTLEQAPDVCKELIEYEVRECKDEALVDTISSFILLTATSIIGYIIIYGIDRSDTNGAMATFFLSSLVIAGLGLFSAMLDSALTNFLKAKRLAKTPKYLILRKLRNLIG